MFTSVCYCDHVLSVGGFKTFGGTVNEILNNVQNPEKPEDGNRPTSKISQSSNTACGKPFSESFKFIASFNLRYWNAECCRNTVPNRYVHYYI